MAKPNEPKHSMYLETISLKTKTKILIKKPVKKIAVFERSEFAIFRALMIRMIVRKYEN